MARTWQVARLQTSEMPQFAGRPSLCASSQQPPDGILLEPPDTNTHTLAGLLREDFVVFVYDGQR
jgi:hypothetical protein